MHPEQGPVAEVARRMADTVGAPPTVAVVLGSGLGGLVARMDSVERAPYPELGLPQSTVAGHASELVWGRLADWPVAVLSGRVHLYEGRAPAEVVRYVRALHAWGVKALILTNSVGGITDGLDPGTLVVVTDHLNFQGTNPLIGPAYAERFPDLSRASIRSSRRSWSGRRRRWAPRSGRASSRRCSARPTSRRPRSGCCARSEPTWWA